MTGSEAPVSDGTRPRMPLRLWHLVLLVAFVAIAIADIQGQRIREPALIGIATGGYALYTLLAWQGWRIAWRAAARIGARAALILYMAAMGLLFLAATAIFLVIEHTYRNGL
jgi:hypothetical protein